MAPGFQLVNLPSEVGPGLLQLQLYFQPAEVVENDGGAAFVVNESDCGVVPLAPFAPRASVAIWAAIATQPARGSTCWSG